MKPQNMSENKRILIAIPTAKYIEVETFQSIWNLEVPDGFELEFRYSYGYTIHQIRNLIASWVVNEKYDYLFAVDSDIILPKDTLTKMLFWDKDIISGLYIQKRDDKVIPEIYRIYPNGMLNVPIQDLAPRGLHEIDGCGFGCALVSRSVFEDVGYPWFEYKDGPTPGTIHISEDNDFCLKAKKWGYQIYVDSSIVCPHVGTKSFYPT